MAKSSLCVFYIFIGCYEILIIIVVCFFHIAILCKGLMLGIDVSGEYCNIDKSWQRAALIIPQVPSRAGPRAVQRIADCPGARQRIRTNETLPRPHCPHHAAVFTNVLLLPFLNSYLDFFSAVYLSLGILFVFFLKGE